MYRSTFSLLRHKLKVSGQLHAPAILTHGKQLPVHIGYEVRVDPKAGQEEVDKRKFLAYCASNSDLFLVQPVASRYTD
jgi:hypothetical protein